MLSLLCLVLRTYPLKWLCFKPMIVEKLSVTSDINPSESAKAKRISEAGTFVVLLMKLKFLKGCTKRT